MSKEERKELTKTTVASISMTRTIRVIKKKSIFRQTLGWKLRLQLLFKKRKFRPFHLGQRSFF